MNMETKKENTEFEKYVNDYTETLRGITDIILKVDLKKELTESEKKQYNKYLKLLNTKKSYDTKVFLDPYRELKKRFNYVLNNDISKLNDNDKIKFYFNLERLKNEIIYYTQTNKLRPQKLDNVVNNIEHIYKVVYSNDFFNSELFQKAKLQKAILNDTFDFDLSHNKKEIVNSDIENRILKVIDKIEAEFKPKGGNKQNKQKFEDFFYNIDKEKISKIKTEFKDLTGIEAAILIDKLVNEYKCLKITQGSHTKGLKAFFESHNLCDNEYAYLQRNLDVKQKYKGGNNKRTTENIENKLNSIF